MSDVEAVLAANRDAVGELLKAVDGAGTVWTTPRAAGKWSPSQLVEHVARALEESAKVVEGAPSSFPDFPAFVRPVVRGLFFNRVVKNGALPKAKTTRALDPAEGPATPEAGRLRLEGAIERFVSACRARAAVGGDVSSSLFGRVSVESYARFQEIHTRHHRKQMPDRA